MKAAASLPLNSRLCRIPCRSKVYVYSSKLEMLKTAEFKRIHLNFSSSSLVNLKLVWVKMTVVRKVHVRFRNDRAFSMIKIESPLAKPGLWSHRPDNLKEGVRKSRSKQISFIAYLRYTQKLFLYRSSTSFTSQAFAIATSASSNPREPQREEENETTSRVSSFREKFKRKDSMLSTAATMRVLNVLKHWVSKHSQVSFTVVGEDNVF